MKSKLLALAFLAGTAMFGQVGYSTGAGVDPYDAYPQAQGYMEAPPSPGPDYTWVDGYWYYNGPRRLWHAGYWAPPVYANRYYSAPRYYAPAPRYYGGGYDRGYRAREWREHERRGGYERGFRR